MDDLIKRLEKATEPDAWLDCNIREAVEGWKNVGGGWREWPDGRREQYDYGYAKPYTASIDAAVALLPDDDHHWKCGYSKHVRHNAEISDLMHPHKGVFIGEHDHSRAIAICIAALRARQHKSR